MCSDDVQVVGTERDLILARRLYEAGDRGERPVVGVVGAAHIKGIKEQWSFVSTPEAALQVAGLMEAPRPDPAGAFASVAITGVTDECRNASNLDMSNMAKYAGQCREAACQSSEDVSACY